MKYYLIAFLSLILFASCSKQKEEAKVMIDGPEAYQKADGFIGGVIYDRFWAQEARFNQFDPNINHYKEFEDFYRCKQCHGWDLLGSEGAYIGRAPNQARPNVNPLNLYKLADELSAEDLFEAIKYGRNNEMRRAPGTDLSNYDPETNSEVGDAMPDFSQILGDEQIWQLVKFLKVEKNDIAQLYDAEYIGDYPNGQAVFSNIGKDGNAEEGYAYYKKTCGLSVCHGNDGTARLIDGELTLGAMIIEDPYEVHHKAKFGNPGSNPPMPGDRETNIEIIKNLYKALTDSTRFPIGN